MANILQERWRVYEIDRKGRLRVPMKSSCGGYTESRVFEDSYPTKQEAKDAILQECSEVRERGWQYDEYTIIEIYEAVDEDKS